MDDVNFRIAVWGAARGMNMKAAKVPPVLEGVFDIQVSEMLVSKGCRHVSRIKMLWRHG